MAVELVLAVLVAFAALEVFAVLVALDEDAALLVLDALDEDATLLVALFSTDGRIELELGAACEDEVGLALELEETVEEELDEEALDDAALEKKAAAVAAEAPL